MAASGKKKSAQKTSVKPSAVDNGHKLSSCPIVGIGASAGGLAAFKTLFSHMPDDSGMAFVLVPHLDPSHQSLMVELIATQTEMSVCEAQHDMAIQPDHIYIIPPGKYLSLQDGKLQLSTPPQSGRIDTAIDFFLRSLAQDQLEKAIGIILSGTSSHGTLGLQAIKANGGLAMVQHPDSAEYKSMPQNAIDSGIVDFILPPAEMPAALIKYIQHAYVSGLWTRTELAESESGQLDRVLKMLRVHTRYDFRNYRKNMIRRRVQRRMGLKHINQLHEYAELLAKNPEEAKQLLRDLLISVTGFFRDPESYTVLQQSVISQWLTRKDNDTPLRIWIPGCATGEEAYSIAILLIEQFSAAQQPLNLQIFATDIDEAALDIARQGIYPVSIAADIGPQRLKRFFTRSDDHFQVIKQLRESFVFAAQNLISDAPFSRLDMISCRNLLIYMEPSLQQKIISLFHFALKPGGHLFLGSSETIGRHLDLFETVSKKWRLYRRIGLSRRDIVEFPITSLSEGRRHVMQDIKPPVTREVNFAELTQRQLLNDYAPASVLINRRYEVLYFQGATGDFLQPPTGEPTRDLLAMARQGLQSKLRAACYKAIRENVPVTDNSLKLKYNASWLACSITVKPIVEPRQAEGLLLVTFQKRETSVPKSAAESDSNALALEDSSIVRQLEYELKATRDDLQTTIEDMESSNEELKASNEEIMSMNEELQSANKELETSKEELQSLNEELSTVNSQLQDKVEELDKAHNDMSNLLNSSDIATLFLDTELCIRQFTPATGKLLGLINSDSGRPISTFASDFTSTGLLDEAQRVLDKLTPVETVIHPGEDRYYLRRVLPYRTADNHIIGLVVTFIDITQRFKAEQQARRMATILQDSSDAISVLNFDGSITAWNRGAEELYGYSEAEALKMNVIELTPPAQQATTLQTLQRIANGEQVKSFDSARQTSDGKILQVWITVTPLFDDSGKPFAVATTERDISQRLQLDALRVQTERLLKMIEHLPAGAVYRENDHLKMNRAAEEITGYRRTEMASIDDWFNKLYGDKVVENRQLYEQDRAAGFPTQTMPLVITRKNGEQRYVEFACYRFNQHEVWLMHDVTRREASEAAMRDREERLRAIMNNAAEAIIVINMQGLVTDFNRAATRLFGFSADEVIGHNVNMLMPSPYRESHNDYLTHYLQTGEPHIINRSRELPGRRKDGSTFPLHLTVTEVDHLAIFIGIMYDLSAQESLERQIADISTAEQERIGQEIHDGLGQQLTGISMLAASLQRQLQERKLPEAEKLHKLSLQLQDTISTARALSRGLVPVPVTPEGLKDAISRLAQEVSDHSNSTIKCSFEAPEAYDIADRTDALQIYRIILEAVNNAVKHAQPSSIKIRFKSDPRTFEFSVTDDGRGFHTDTGEFEGVGLRIMRYRAGIIGCNLSIESAPGKGTVVHCKHAAY